MNKSLLALAAVASFAGSANAKDQSNVISPGRNVANTGMVSPAEASLFDTTAGSVDRPAVTVLGEMKVMTIALACGCYPNRCGE